MFGRGTSYFWQRICVLLIRCDLLHSFQKFQVWKVEYQFLFLRVSIIWATRDWQFQCSRKSAHLIFLPLIPRLLVIVIGSKFACRLVWFYQRRHELCRKGLLCQLFRHPEYWGFYVLQAFHRKRGRHSRLEFAYQILPSRDNIQFWSQDPFLWCQFCLLISNRSNKPIDLPELKFWKARPYHMTLSLVKHQLLESQECNFHCKS